MHLKYGLFTLLVLSITACSNSDLESKPIGGDRDEYGCLPSAGYLWCERTQRCERSWELADAVGILHTEAEVKTYCDIIDDDDIEDDEGVNGLNYHY
ncbi:hypothetical protein [Moritella sp.]|uniref:hypothetical protein n=1 Tax=Moritella sp. TaxID=78556 RepID=UPI001D5E6CCD|nr:hypothetical protein [Moritella sp.]MCJ8350115.1 hypothetical protein [Moritella sp.]NQZ40944.1 hypothetical protein [Moritella sp.]